MSTFTPRQMFLLDIACHPIREAFGAVPYLVGTAMAPRDGKPPRDVDVRLMLDDKAHRKLTKAIGPQGIAFLGLAIGQYLESLTGLPVDFQIQQRTAANEHHGGKVRNPLGLRSLANFEGDSPIVGEAV